jgi:chlorophyll(ide) b reductase
MNNVKSMINNRYNRIQTKIDLKQMRSKKDNLNVVITGGTRGLGLAMTKEFSKYGDNVFIVSRNPYDVDKIVQTVDNVYGCASDIGDTQQNHVLMENILNAFDGHIDMFLNCAGQSGGNRQFLEHDINKIESIIKTNLVGTSICCKSAYDIMINQTTGGSIFNFTGAGSNGSSTPNYSVYGATKAGILQLTRSLQDEWRGTNVDLHLVSPGMLLTDLLLENMSDETYDVIKTLCASPELVAHHIVPSMRRVYYHAKEDDYIKFLTLLKIIYKMGIQRFLTNNK